MSEPERISYDLVKEPWIPCERPDGSRVVLGIEKVLTQAHSFAALHDESPLVTATLHRLLLAILHRVFLPRTMEDWVTLWEAPTFDAEKVRAYLNKWRERFDLFHPERPFLQVAKLGEVLLKERGKEPRISTAWRLAMERSIYSKNAVQLLEPLASGSDEPLSPSAAAQALLAFQAYAPGGTIDNQGPWDAANLRGGAVVVVRDDTLKRTLLCNLVWQSHRQLDDLPPWERDRAIQPISRAHLGLVDLLVWPARRVELLPEVSANATSWVSNVVTAAGERLLADTPDPMFGYVVRDPKNPPFAVRIGTGRSAWRDAAALFDAATGSEAFRRPIACTQLAELVRQGVVPRHVRFQVELLGLVSDQAKIDLWRADRMPLPPSLLTDGARVSALRDALSLAEVLGSAIDYDVLSVLAENVLAPSAREAHKKDIGKLKDTVGAMPAYWAALGQAFTIWLDALGRTDDVDRQVVDWKGTLRSTARSVVNDAERHLGSGARALQAGAKADRALRRVLRKVLGSDLEEAGLPMAIATTEGASK